MKGLWKYLLVGLGVFLAACLIALPFLGGWGRPWMAGRWMMRPMFMPRMFLIHDFGIFRWLGWFGMILILLLILGLVAAGVTALLRGQRRDIPPASSCPNCRRPVQSGWVACPYCGQNLKPGEINSPQDSGAVEGQG